MITEEGLKYLNEKNKDLLDKINGRIVRCELIDVLR